MPARFAFLLAAILTLGACGSAPSVRTYPLHGQILEMSADHRQAVIKHDEIKGFMSAMTMSYKVRDEQLFSGLVPGDIIDATLTVASNEAYLTAVKKVGQAPIEKAQADPSFVAPTAHSGFELLKVGEAVPDGTFVDQDGTARMFSAFKGAPVVVTFMYTRCPLPNFCPLMDRNFVALQRAFATDASLAKVRLVSISFDPLSDTPRVLKEHAKELGADTSRWSFFTGDRDDIDQFAARFGMTISRALDDALNITHNLRTAIVDANGKLAKVYTGNEWTPDQLLMDLKPIAAAHAD